MREIDDCDVPVGIQKIQAEIELAEVELRIARAKVAYLDMKQKAELEAKTAARATPSASTEQDDLEE